MKLINFAIHRNSAPSLSDGPPPFRPIVPENAINVVFALQFDDEAEALSFASTVLVTIQNYGNK